VPWVIRFSIAKECDVSGLIRLWTWSKVQDMVLVSLDAQMAANRLFCTSQRVLVYLASVAPGQ
jgi:hypothetical protein